MTGKQISAAVLILGLGGLSLYLNRDSFKSQPIQISCRSLPPRGVRSHRSYGRSAGAAPTIFLLSKELKLTSVKVVSAEDAATNKYPHALWELVSASHSVPVKEFLYGARISGMKPPLKREVAEPLQPGTKYRVIISAGSATAEHDFVPVRRRP